VAKEFPKQVRILVVDDDKGARESLEEILEDDYDVVCVEYVLRMDQVPWRRLRRRCLT